MINGCPEASWPEEVNTVQVGYIHTSAGAGGMGAFLTQSIPQTGNQIPASQTQTGL